MMSEVEKLNMMFASNEMPDMVNAAFWGNEAEIIRKAGREGRLTDLSQLVPNYPNIADVWDIGVISRRYYEADICDPVNNGAIYILPDGPGTPQELNASSYGIWVRGDVPDALGIDPSGVKTTEDLYQFMKKAQEYGFKDINGNDCITATTFHNGWNYDDYLANFTKKKLSVYDLGEDGRVTMDDLEESFVDKYTFIWKLVNEGILDKECFTTNDDRANEKVGNGTALFTCALYSVTIDATKRSGLYEAHPEMRYVPVGPLNYSDGTPLKTAVPEGNSSSGVVFLPSTCKNVKAALTFLDYCNSKEGLRLIQYGFEGDTYELNKDGQPRMNEELVESYRENSEATKKKLIDRGILYLSIPTYRVKKSIAYFGESEPFAEVKSPELIAAEKMRPIEVIKGFQIDVVSYKFDKWPEINELLDGEKRKSYVERAFFAKSEEEAREILRDYQEYLRTSENGILQEYLDYLTGVYESRDDVVF